MESDNATLEAAIVNAIEKSSFPDSEQVLLSEIDHTSTDALLRTLKVARENLSQSVRVVSRQEAGDVDGWISQAKRVQADIARCKEDARLIVQEHERTQELHRARDEARNKSRLIEDEISFNETLEKQIQSISTISASLGEIDHDVRKRQSAAAAHRLPVLAASIETIASDQTRTMFSRLHSDLQRRVKELLQEELDARFHVSTRDSQVLLCIQQETNKDSQSPPADTHSVEQVSVLSLDQVLQSIKTIDSWDDVIAQLSRRTDAAILPHLHKRSKFKVINAGLQDGAILLTLTSEMPCPEVVVSAVLRFLQCLHETCPTSIRQSLVTNLLTQALPLIIVDWLDPALPIELDRLKDLDGLMSDVSRLNKWLEASGYSEAREVQVWMNQISRIWVSRRRAFSLDAVRRAFKSATGSMRQVERVESQIVNVKGQLQPDVSDDDWAENWDDDNQSDDRVDKHSEDTGDDASDAWGFDADDQPTETSNQSAAVELVIEKQEDETDAWGWGDDEDTKPDPAVPQSSTSAQANGTQSSRVEQRDIVLKESYSITDIPEYIIEQIGKDLSDHEQLSASPSTYFRTSSASSSGLDSLPTLTLAMFRAMATTSYQGDFSPPLSNMNIYNDTLFLISQFSTANVGPHQNPGLLYDSLKPEIPILEKFARQMYTSELSTHRTILLDLLDNAQGFVSCTRSPYAESCEIAISGTTGHIRTLHTEWSRILSPSHLCQSIGSLLNSVMRKMIEDIEDMEDISEPESRKLLSLCEAVSKLEDLFMVERPAAGSFGQQSEEGAPLSTAALHCTSFLRFQYLQQILDSNLADIRYLWSDAGLSLEFRSEEVIDLIKALFAESTLRRSAINAIKG